MAGTRLFIVISFLISFICIIGISCYYGLIVNDIILYNVLFQQNGRDEFYKFYTNITTNNITTTDNINDNNIIQYTPYHDIYRSNILPSLLLQPIIIMTADSQMDYWKSTLIKIYQKYQKLLNINHNNISDHISIITPMNVNDKDMYRDLCLYYRDSNNEDNEEEVVILETMTNDSTTMYWINNQHIQMYMCENYFNLPILNQSKLIILSSTSMLFYPTSLHRRGYEFHSIYPKISNIIKNNKRNKNNNRKKHHHPIHITYMIESDNRNMTNDNSHDQSKILLKETNQWWKHVIDTFQDNVSVRQRIPLCLWDHDDYYNYIPKQQQGTTRLQPPFVHIISTVTTTTTTTTTTLQKSSIDNDELLLSTDNIQQLILQNMDRLDKHNNDNNNDHMNWLLLLTPSLSSFNNNSSPEQQPQNEYDSNVVYYDNTYFRIIPMESSLLNSYQSNNSNQRHDYHSNTTTILPNALSDLLDRYISSTCLGIPQDNVTIHHIRHMSSQQHDHNQMNNNEESLLLYPSFYSHILYQRKLKHTYNDIYRLFYSICSHYNSSTYRVPIPYENIKLLKDAYHKIHHAAITATLSHDDDDTINGDYYYNTYLHRMKLFHDAYNILYHIKYDHDNDHDHFRNNNKYNNNVGSSIIEPLDIPWEQYGAMLAPLVLPILLPLLITFLREMKRYRQLIKKDKDKSNSNNDNHDDLNDTNENNHHNNDGHNNNSNIVNSSSSIIDDDNNNDDDNNKTIIHHEPDEQQQQVK